MRLRRILAVALLAASIAAADLSAADAPPELASDEAKTAYAVGLTIWRNLEPLDLTPAEVAIVVRALEDAAAGRPPAIDYAAWAPKIQQLSGQRTAARAERMKAEGAAFADREAAEPGAVRTESGMVYRELVAGSGKSPKARSTVEVHYRGTLIDGTPFDSSYDRGEPTKFRLDQVIDCWTEGLQRMQAGGKARLVCPSDIAYGDRGRPAIPGGATLVFEIELLSVD